MEKLKRLFLASIIAFLFFLFLFLSSQSASAGSFKADQRKFPRVKEAYKLKEDVLKKLFEEKGLHYPPKQIFFRVFKVERKFEVWVIGKEKKFVLLKEYGVPPRINSFIGPKRRKSDLLVPEGFYKIVVFNHNSKFYLSLGINYPNELDKLVGDKDNPGEDIFIHGGRASLGCIPLTNDGIQEVYLLAVEAQNAGQKSISIHIFPARLLMKKDGLETVIPEFDPALIEFWKNLREGYNFFETNKILPQIQVKSKRYMFQKPKS